MVAKDVAILVFPLLLLDLESCVKDFVLTCDIRQLYKHFSFGSSFGQNVGYHTSLARLQIPHMDVMNVDHSFDLLAFVSKFDQIDVLRSGFH